jgi:DNA-binding NarL/FixJ family response regulator
MHGNGNNTMLLVSTPGIIQEATTAMLNSLSQVAQIQWVSGALSAIEWLRNEDSFLLVIDANIPAEEAELLVRWAKQHHPDTRCIVLVRSMVELERARAAGTDAAFLRSSSAKQLAEFLK